MKIVRAACVFVVGIVLIGCMLGTSARYGEKAVPIDQPPELIQPEQPGKRFSVHRGRGGWWAHIEGHAYPFGAWRMDRGPYPFRWMAELEFPIERLTKDGPRR